MSNNKKEFDKKMDKLFDEMTKAAMNDKRYTKNLGKAVDDVMQEIFGDTIDISGENSYEAFMKQPILNINVSRLGTNITGGQCSEEDMLQAVGNAITSSLNLIPKKWRKDLVKEALSKCDNDEGELYDEKGTLQRCTFKRKNKN